MIVDEGTLAALRQEWLRTTGREPGAAELDALVRDRVDEELLVRAALSHGLHRSDALVLRRLIQNQRFLDASEGREQESDAVLLERAYVLGLERSDVVVRRRLVERMREILLARDGAPGAAEPDEAAPPSEPVLRITQLMVSRDRYGDDAEATADALLARLRTEAIHPESPALAGLGDPLLLPRDLPPLSADRLARRFGPAFAEGVTALPIGVWSGPIPSSYGLHLVWLHERSDRQRAAVSSAARWRTAAQERESLESGLQILRQGVDVIRYDHPTSP